ncbi:hypothetical protein M9Y10_012188 [Tritrichomonas musculus]|uniref:non-specific serine/threonine protein kinase n=1 Tax=Tritrichomonas musculus TaxID=1915356 RepID=A0ABR2IBV1_9EUKA
MTQDHPEYLEITESRIYKDVNKKLGNSSSFVDKFEINIGNIRNYQLICPIGSGKYSTVFYGKIKKKKEEPKANEKIKPQKCAIKILKFISFQRIKREICIIDYLQGIPNIVKLFDSVRDLQSKTISIITEYDEPINIANFYPTLTLDEIRHLMFNLLVALDLCHKKGVMHRDVKPGNIIIRPDRNNLFLIDWGLAEFYFPNQRYSTRVSTLRYKAPELLLNYEYYDYGVDIWGAGVSFGEMLVKYPFFEGRNLHEMIACITSLWGLDKMINYFGRYGLAVLPETIQLFPKNPESQWDKVISSTRSMKRDNEAFDLLKKLLTIDHAERITAKEALMHPFFDSIRDELCIKCNYVFDD